MIGVVNLTNRFPQVVDTKELPIGKQLVPEAIVVLQNLVCIVTRCDFNLRKGRSNGIKILCDAFGKGVIKSIHRSVSFLPIRGEDHLGVPAITKRPTH